jgi:hypothetical protein
MLRRGYNHNSPLNCSNLLWEEGFVDSLANLVELKRRCPKCKERIERNI